MSNTSCTEFNRLLEESIEVHLPLDTPRCAVTPTSADCRLAWLDALLLDGAVSQRCKSANARLPLVDLTDVALYRKAAAQAETVSVGSEQRANPVAANEPIASTPGMRPLVGARVAGGSGRNQAVAAFARPPNRCLRCSGNCRRRLCRCFGRSSEPAARLKPSRESDIPVAAAENFRGYTDLPDCLARSTSAEFGYEVARQSRCRSAARNARRRSAPGAFDQAIENVLPATAASVSATHPGSGATTAAPTGDDDRWVDDVGRQFEPMGSNLSQAFHFLWEAVPAKKAPAI